MIAKCLLGNGGKVVSGKEEEAAEGLAGLGDVSDEVAEKSRGGRLGPSYEVGRID